jgi:hypothetical protein
LQRKEKLRNILISAGITDEKEIERSIDIIINGLPDMSEYMTPENRVDVKFIKKNKAA